MDNFEIATFLRDIALNPNTKNEPPSICSFCHTCGMPHKKPSISSINSNGRSMIDFY